MTFLNRIGFLIIFLFFFTNPCDAYFCREFLNVRPEQQSEVYVEFRKFIDRGLIKFNPHLDWGLPSSRSISLPDLVNLSLQLKEHERQTLLLRLESAHEQKAFKPAYFNLISLVLMSEQAWLSLIDSGISFGSKHYAVEALAPLYRLLPYRVKSRVKAHIQTEYHRADKRYFQDSSSFPSVVEIPQRRFMDAFINYALGPQREIVAAVGRGVSALEAYNTHLQYMAQFQVYNLSYEAYRAEDILSVSEALRVTLSEIQNAYPQAGTPRIAIAGSFPWGTASISRSDLDVRFVGAGAKEFMHYVKNSGGDFLVKAEERVREALSGKFSKINLQLNEFWSPESRLGRITPLVLYIDPSSISLFIYGVPEPKVYREIFIDRQRVFSRDDFQYLEAPQELLLWEI